MTYREFTIPPDHDVEAVLGVCPQHVDEIGVRRVALEGADRLGAEITLDSLGRSVTLTVDHDGREIFRIFREGATDLRLSDASPEIVIAFRTADTKGQLELSLKPSIHVAEIVLLG